MEDIIFFVCPPTPYSWLTHWETDLPSQPPLGHFKEDIVYASLEKLLEECHFYIGHLISEDLLYYYKLSSVETELNCSLGSYLVP